MKQHRYILGILIFITCLLLLYIPTGDFLFGSNVDWLNQHVRIAQHIRDACYEQGTLIPEYSTLGGGSNMFMFAYYGILRLDILVSLLIPHIEMQYILITYAIVSLYVSCLLCFFWLKHQGLSPNTCFIATLLLACATCFFQAHRQLMFINYLPFLFLLLQAMDHQKKHYMVIAIIGIFTHSFFFSISCFIVGILYVNYKSYSYKNYILAWMIGCGICAMLLLPSALAILEQRKDAGTSHTMNLLSLQLDLKNILYSPYGCGLTLISLYGLLYGIYNPRTKRLSIIVSILCILSLCSYLLNATLYVRSKTYIPFVVIFILLLAYALEDLKKLSNPTKIKLCILLLCMLVTQTNKFLYFIDFSILCIFLYVQQRYTKPWTYLIVLLFPIVLSISTNRSETYVAKKQLQEPFTTSQLQAFYKQEGYRFDTMYAPLTNANHLPLSNMKKSTMYSSTMNDAYASFYYDITKTPISIKNRVALLANNNPFLQHMMSVRYLQTTLHNVPIGYAIKQQNKNYVLAENKNVKPILYATSQLMSEQQFQSYDFPYNLVILSNHAIVKHASNTSYDTLIKELPLPTGVQKDSNISLKKPYKKTMALPKMENDHILIISFDVLDAQGKEVSIRINGTQNKLSSAKANYPNHHTNFVYYVNATNKKATIQLSIGNYTIKNLTLYSVPYNALLQQNIQPIKLQKQTDPTTITGEIDWQQSGYLISSIPYQKGYRAKIDGKDVAIEKVNHAFIGFPLEKGLHTIQLTYQAPGKRLGFLITSISSMTALVLFYKNRKKETT